MVVALEDVQAPERLMLGLVVTDLKRSHLAMAKHRKRLECVLRAPVLGRVFIAEKSLEPGLPKKRGRSPCRISIQLRRKNLPLEQARIGRDQAVDDRILEAAPRSFEIKRTVRGACLGAPFSFFAFLSVMTIVAMSAGFTSRNNIGPMIPTT
jgi:hypothetical protein